MPRNQMAVFKLRVARLNQGLSPEALGRKIGVAGGTIRRLEKGETPTPTVGRKVAEWAGEEATDIWPELLVDGKAAERA